MITTYLCGSQLNNLVPDPNVQTLLNEVKELTGTDWQIIPQSVPVTRWFGLKTDTVLMYTLTEFITSQEELGEEFSQVLYDNLWELYEN